MASGSRPVQSVERALAILETVAAAGEAGVTEIAGRVGLHVATTHNLLRTLAARHYLANHGGRYRLGPSMALLAARWNPTAAFAAEVQPTLRRIVEATGEAASCSVLTGTVLKLAAYEPGTHPLALRAPRWEWPNAVELATGRILVAREPEDRWELFVDLGGREAEPTWSRARWREEFRRIRVEGIAIRFRPGDNGNLAIACPVRMGEGAIMAAVGATAPHLRADAERMGALARCVYDEARELSRRLCHPGADLSTPPLPAIDWTKPTAPPPPL